MIYKINPVSFHTNCSSWKQKMALECLKSSLSTVLSWICYYFTPRSHKSSRLPDTFYLTAEKQKFHQNSTVQPERVISWLFQMPTKLLAPYYSEHSLTKCCHDKKKRELRPVHWLVLFFLNKRNSFFLFWDLYNIIRRFRESYYTVQNDQVWASSWLSFLSFLNKLKKERLRFFRWKAKILCPRLVCVCAVDIVDKRWHIKRE